MRLKVSETHEKFKNPETRKPGPKYVHYLVQKWFPESENQDARGWRQFDVMLK